MRKEELDYWTDKMKFDRETRELEERGQKIFSLVLIFVMLLIVGMTMYYFK
jgi:hypothetical protein